MAEESASRPGQFLPKDDQPADVPECEQPSVPQQKPKALIAAFVLLALALIGGAQRRLR